MLRPASAGSTRAVNQALQRSADARDAHDQICTFIDQHRLASTGSDLAQYISLALYITPPPDLAPSAEGADMPPDATGWKTFCLCCGALPSWLICTGLSARSARNTIASWPNYTIR